MDWGLELLYGHAPKSNFNVQALLPNGRIKRMFLAKYQASMLCVAIGTLRFDWNLSMMPLSAHTKKFEASAASPQILKNGPVEIGVFLRLTDLFFFNTQANISKQIQKIPIYFFVPWLICAFPFAPHSKHWKSTLDYNFTRPMRRLLPTKSGFCRTKTRILKDQLLGNSSKGRKYPHHLFGKQSQKPLHPWIFATRRRT